MSSAAYEDITAAVERIRVYFGLTLEGDHIKRDLDTITASARDLDREASNAYGRGRDDEAIEAPMEVTIVADPSAVVRGAERVAEAIAKYAPTARPLCTCEDGLGLVEGPDGVEFCGACGGAPS